MSEIPEDIMQVAEDALWHGPNRQPLKEAIAKAILAERQKGEKVSDDMYLTGVHDAYSLAKRIGYQDFADRLIAETNEKARRSGLPELKVTA